MIRQAIAVAALTLVSTVAQAQQPAPDSPASDFIVEAPLLSAAPAIDGRLEEALWEEATLLDRFTQVEPDEGSPATERTEIRIGYDEKHLYFGVRCDYSEPDKIVAVTMDRDGELFNDDTVDIVLDTFSDKKNGFIFSINPLGAQKDGLLRNEGDEVNYSWDGIWEVATSRDARGWTAEIAIPFRTLRFPKQNEQTWGLNVRRVVIHKREYLIWSPIPRYSGAEALFKVSQAGKLRGLRNLKQGRRFDLRPYMIGKWQREGGQDDDTTFDVGVDVKKNLTSDLVLDLTYNLDFAEAEADEQQINLTRFKLYYPEKRDFFLEGANLFYVGERADYLKQPDKLFFFSRRIGIAEDGRHEIPVLGGAKISGQLAGTGIGFLNLTLDELTYLDRLGQQRYEPRTNYTVLRLRRDVVEGSTLGLMWLNKEVSGGRDNSGTSMDWDLAFGNNFKTGGFLAKTSTPGLEGTDWAGMIDVIWDSRYAFLKGVYTEIGEAFNPEMGFFPRVGIREYRANATLNLRPQIWNLRNFLIFDDFTYITDRDGNLETQVNRFEIDMVWKNFVALAVKYFENAEGLDYPFEISPGVVIPPGKYYFRNFFFGIQTIPGRPFYGFARISGGQFYDGDFRTLFLGARIRPTVGLRTRFSIEHTEVDLPAGTFDVDLATARVIYALSPRLSVRAFVQWRKGDNLDANLLFQWLYKPGAAFYVVYDEFRDLTDNPENNAYSRDRALITKVGFFF